MKEEWLKKVSEKNDDWLGIATSFVGEQKAFDIVQDMYKNLDRWADESIIKQDGEVNRCYIYLNIRTLCYVHFKEQKKRATAENDEVEALATSRYESYNKEKDLAWQLILDNVNVLVDSWRWNDKTLFNLYKDTPFSLRGLAKETDISWMSIHQTVKKCKALIKEEFYEDYQDFINKDYELIKPFKITKL